MRRYILLPVSRQHVGRSERYSNQATRTQLCGGHKACSTCQVASLIMFRIETTTFCLFYVLGEGSSDCAQLRVRRRAGRQPNQQLIAPPHHHLHTTHKQDAVSRKPTTIIVRKWFFRRCSKMLYCDCSFPFQFPFSQNEATGSRRSTPVSRTEPIARMKRESKEIFPLPTSSLYWRACDNSSGFPNI